jgi:hypothetical protein
MPATGALLLIAITMTLSQTASAQHVGLLLGLSEAAGNDSMPASLTTAWIAFDGRVARRSTLRGVVVPRATGFWRMTLIRDCDVPDTGDGDDLDRVHCYDSLWTAPITQPLPTVLARWAEPCTTEYYDLHFAFPSYIALSSRLWESDCAARSFADTYRSWVRTFESDDAVPFTTLGDGADDAYATAARTALNVGTALDEPAPQDSTCAAQPLEQHGWHIERDSTHWRGVLFQQQGSELCQVQSPVDWPMPSAVVGYAEPPVPWSVVSRLEPQAQQAFAAPGGALLLVVAPNGIRLYAFDTGPQGRRLLELPASRVVMVQWALGRSTVARWARILATIE